MEIEDDKRIQDPPPPLELEATFTAGVPTFSADIALGPLPKPPRHKRFIKLAKALFKVVKVVGTIGSAIRGGQTIWDVLEPLLGRKRQPAQA